MTEQQLKAYWAERLDIARFQQKLNAETEDGKYEMLKQLLVAGFQKFEKTRSAPAFLPFHAPLRLNPPAIAEIRP